MKRHGVCRDRQERIKETHKQGIMTDRRALMPHANKEQMNNYRIRWTDGHDREFEEFHAITENFYNQLVGGPQNRQSFVPGNQSKDVKYAMIVYSKDDVPVACSGLKEHGNGDVEIKRVWVQLPFRGHQLATFMMHELETFAREHGYKRTVLMTRERMDYAIKLYEGLGYKRIENYPPYQNMDDAVCYAKDLPAISLTV